MIIHHADKIKWQRVAIDLSRPFTLKIEMHRTFDRVALIFIGLFLLSGVFSSAWPGPPCRSAVSAEHADGVVAFIVRVVAERLNMHVEMQLAPFARRLQWMKTGKLDIMGGLLRRPERETYIYYVSPPYVDQNRKVFYVRKGEESRIRCYKDLYGLVIGTKIRSRYFHPFDTDQRLTKEAVSNVEQNFRKLLSGRIDAVIYSNRSGGLKIAEMGITDRVGVAPYAYTASNPVYIGISRQSPLMAKRSEIEAVVHKMVESGEMRALIAEYHRRHNPADAP